MEVEVAEKGEIKDRKMESKMKQKKCSEKKAEYGWVWETAKGNYINKNKAKN